MRKRRAWRLCLALIGALGLGAASVPAYAAGTTAASGVYHEPYRPQFHFSPPQNWMNDPNGLIYDKGVYNLFYQYNPTGSEWGDISWGHAVSKDLVHWTQKPVAIPAAPDELIWSGSAVLDSTNSSGFGTAANPPMVAIYTSETPSTGLQAQSLAYSTDGGTTWTKYAGNPVININSQNFRDPKVFWYAPTKSWRMIVSESALDRVRIYSSPNLKQWTLLSMFGPAGASNGVWECPDLFPLAVDGNPKHVKWVLMVNTDSSAQYFVGNFDGSTFTPDEPATYTPPAGTVLENFDGSGYGDWSATGDAFGSGPAQGTLPNQNPVSGYEGTGLASSYNGEDTSTGSLTSPNFTITKPYMNFLVGGGDNPYVPGTDDQGAGPDGTVLQDFDSGGYGDWTTTGTAFGSAPATGGVDGQMSVSNFEGTGLANSFNGGDASTGTLTSPSFTIDKPAIDLLVGGGDHPWGSATPTAVNLVVNGTVVDTATGENSEALDWRSWNVAAYQGQQARIEVVDEDSTTGAGAWSHVMVDDVMQSAQTAQVFDDFEGTDWGTGWTGTGDFATTGPKAESLPGTQGAQDLDTCIASTDCDAAEGTITSPTFTVSTDDIDLRVGGGDYPESGPNPTAVNLLVGGKVVASSTGDNSSSLTWTHWDTTAYRGQQAQIQVVDDNDGSAGWGHIIADDIVFSDHAALPTDTQTAVDLVVGGKVVDSATGSNSEYLDWTSFDLHKLMGRQATIEIVDHATGGWGHVSADDFMLADKPATSSLQRTHWVDFGDDFYAANSYNDAPDGQRIMMAWMVDPGYGGSIPTSPWRGEDTVPRELALRTIGGSLQLTQAPVPQLATLHTGAPATQGRTQLHDTVRTLPINGEELDLNASFTAGSARQFGLDVRTGAGQRTRISYDTRTHTLSLDRTQAGLDSFDPGFANVRSAPLPLDHGRLDLRILVDASSVEVFAGQGQVVMTDQIFPDASSTGVDAFATGGTATLDQATGSQMASIWP